MGKLGIEFSQITLARSRVCLGKVNLAMQKAPEPRAPGGNLWEWRENEAIHSSATPCCGPATVPGSETTKIHDSARELQTLMKMTPLQAALVRHSPKHFTYMIVLNLHSNSMANTL